MQNCYQVNQIMTKVMSIVLKLLQHGMTVGMTILAVAWEDSFVKKSVSTSHNVNAEIYRKHTFYSMLTIILHLAFFHGYNMITIVIPYTISVSATRVDTTPAPEATDEPPGTLLFYLCTFWLFINILSLAYCTVM